MPNDLTPAEAAAELRIGRTLLYQLVADAELETYKVGTRLRRITRESLDSFKERNMVADRVQSGGASS